MVVVDAWGGSGARKLGLVEAGLHGGRMAPEVSPFVELLSLFHSLVGLAVSDGVETAAEPAHGGSILP